MMAGSGTSVRGGMVVGHGLDVVDIADFSRLLCEPACRFLDRHFTNEEFVAAGRGTAQAQRLAGRFAVKEAVMKALGLGWGNGVAFTDVEVITLETGAPTVVLRRKLASIEQARGIVKWFVSVSHTSRVAVASVIAVSDR
jgi:holo-[acyl-carrier protein] synthase